MRCMTDNFGPSSKKGAKKTRAEGGNNNARKGGQSTKRTKEKTRHNRGNNDVEVDRSHSYTSHDLQPHCVFAENHHNVTGQFYAGAGAGLDCGQQSVNYHQPSNVARLPQQNPNHPLPAPQFPGVPLESKINDVTSVEIRQNGDPPIAERFRNFIKEHGKRCNGASNDDEKRKLTDIIEQNTCVQEVSKNGAIRNHKSNYIMQNENARGYRLPNNDTGDPAPSDETDTISFMLTSFHMSSRELRLHIRLCNVSRIYCFQCTPNGSSDVDRFLHTLRYYLVVG